MKMKVVMAEPGQYARAAEIGDGLESLQKAVGGLIDCAYPWREKVCIVCNDEGLITGNKSNRLLQNRRWIFLRTMTGRMKFGSTLSASSRRLRCRTESCAAVRPSRTGRTCPNTSGTHCSGISRASIRMVGAKDLSRGILKWMEAF